MTHHLPEAFEHYFSLGIGRSYAQVAKDLGVAKSTIVERAKRENWQERVQEFERAARDVLLKDARTELAAVRERQLKAVRALLARALEALRDPEPGRAIRAASALQIALKHELLLVGEPTERNASIVEEVTKRELATLLMAEGEEEDWSAFDGQAEGALHPARAPTAEATPNAEPAP